MTDISRRLHTETQDPHWVEWVTGIFSTLLVLATIGFVGFEAVTEKHQPPEFNITITSRSAVEGGYRVEFDIGNRATRTAAGVVVRGEVVGEGTDVGDAEVTFDYVPAQSKSSGALFFLEDPGQREVRIRAIGYTDP
jgi:uncharacterized protein (TIGR02588 family)